MSLEAFASVIRPKVHGSWNLHTMLPQDMEFCIFMSSASGISGVRGQANYAAGNTYMDALARYRVSKGLKATSLDLGVVMSSGYVAERPEVQQGLKGLGYISIQEAELLSILEYYCDPSREVLSDSRCQLITGLDTPASMRAQNLEEAYWMCKSQFKMLYQVNNTSATNTSPNPESDPDVSSLLSGAGSIAKSADIISSSLMSKLSKVLSMPQENIDASKPMHVFGVDSLIAVEIRNWFNKKLNANVTVFDILGNVSISQVCFEAAGKI